MRDIKVPQPNLRVHPILRHHQKAWLKFQAKVKEAEDDFIRDRLMEEKHNANTR